ncbi:Ferric reductase NAD binding domain family protein [Candida albicans]|uniref:Ferric reductase NAD binding domain family protein n=1 Tax=Candida albicans TaxID=5476 RepID=A0A8H6BV97_CANAX|nr:Ferric reductase NAD binding domain family protein [Candida albicans]
MKLLQYIIVFIITSLNGSLVAASVGSPFTLYKGSKPFYSCNNQISDTVSFCIEATDYQCLCTNKNYLATVAGCLKLYNWFNDSLQLYLQQAKSKNQIQNFNKSSPLETPFILNQTALMLYQQTYNMYYANLDNSLYYGAACLGYWLLMLLVIGLVNWTKVLFPNFVKKLTSPIVNKWRKYISAPATFKRKKAEEQRLFKIVSHLILSRFDSMIVFGFYILTSCKNYVSLFVIHAAAFSYLFGDNYNLVMSETNFIWAVVAIVCGGIIMFQALLYFRRKWYEVFLVAHIVLAIFWTVGLWYHVQYRGLARLFAFGFPQADITLIADETLKVQVQKPKYWKSVPGGHAFIHFLDTKYFWQSHPFTFIEEESGSIIFFCKVKDGITRSLYNRLLSSPGKSTKVRVTVEGPYGEPTPARYADSAVFLAGGNGIPGIYSEVVDAAQGSSTGEKKNKFKLVWVVREWKSLFWFYQELVNLKDLDIDTTIYVTRPESQAILSGDIHEKPKKDGVKVSVNKVDGEEEEEDSESDGMIDNIKSELDHIQFHEGRPNIEFLVDRFVEQSNGSIAFVACAHHSMVDEIRYYCAHKIDNPEKKRVDFYEQVQVWA